MFHFIEVNNAVSETSSWIMVNRTVKRTKSPLVLMGLGEGNHRVQTTQNHPPSGMPMHFSRQFYIACV